MGSGNTKPANKPKLEDAIAHGREKTVLDLVERTPELLNGPLDDNGMRALQFACRDGQTHIVKALLAKGAQLDLKNNQGATALMYAAGGGYEKMCKLLLDAGADVRIEDANSKTALSYAQLHSRAKVENLLQMYACEYTW